MYHRLSLGILLWTSVVCGAAEVKPSTQIREHTLAHIHYSGEKGYVFVVAVRNGKLITPDMYDVSPGHVIFTGPPGQYLVHGIEDGKRFSLDVVIGEPTPIPPIPPKPDPQPDPKPDPGPGPLPVGLRVLIVEETADRGRLPREQLQALLSPRVRTYLNAKATRGQDGKTPDWRLWDDDYTADQLMDGDYFAQAYQRSRVAAKGKLPWIDINGQGYPFPLTEDELLALLKAHGG